MDNSLFPVEHDKLVTFINSPFLTNSKMDFSIFKCIPTFYKWTFCSSWKYFLFLWMLILGKKDFVVLEWMPCHSYAETLCSPKLSYHRIVSLALYLPILYFSFYRKKNLHLYKGARLTLLLFSFSIDFPMI